MAHIVKLIDIALYPWKYAVIKKGFYLSVLFLFFISAVVPGEQMADIWVGNWYGEEIKVHVEGEEQLFLEGAPFVILEDGAVDDSGGYLCNFPFARFPDFPPFFTRKNYSCDQYSWGVNKDNQLQITFSVVPDKKELLGIYRVVLLVKKEKKDDAQYQANITYYYKKRQLLGFAEDVRMVHGVPLSIRKETGKR